MENIDLEKRIKYWEKLLNGDTEKARKNALKELEIDKSNALSSKSWYHPNVRVIDNCDEDSSAYEDEDSDGIIGNIAGCGERTYMVIRYPQLSSIIDKISSCNEFTPVEEMGINQGFSLETDKEKRPVIVDKLEDLIYLPYKVGALGVTNVEPSLSELSKSAETFLKYIKNISVSDFKEVRKEEERSYYTLLLDLAVKFKEATGRPILTGKYFTSLLKLDKVNWKDILFNGDGSEIVKINRIVRATKYGRKCYRLGSTVHVLSDYPSDYRFIIPILKEKFSPDITFATGKLIDLEGDRINLPLKLYLVKNPDGAKRYSNGIIEYVRSLQPWRKYFPIYEVDENGNEVFINTADELIEIGNL